MSKTKRNKHKITKEKADASFVFGPFSKKENTIQFDSISKKLCCFPMCI